MVHFKKNVSLNSQLGEIDMECSVYLYKLDI